MLVDKSEMFGKIKERVKERDELLEEKPNLRPLQDKYEDLMKKAGSNRHNRCVLAQKLLMEHFNKMRDALNGLMEDLDNLSVRCNNEKSKLSICQDGGSERCSGEDGL